MHEGKMLDRILGLKGLTRQQFADLMGVNRQSVQDWIKLQELPAGRLKQIEGKLKIKFYSDKPLEELLMVQEPEIVDYKMSGIVEKLEQEIRNLKADVYDIKKKIGM